MRAQVLVVLALMWFSGCVDGAGPVEAGDLLSEARSHARDLVPGAELAMIAGWEPFSHAKMDDFEANVHIDMVQADGRAPGWIYVFSDGTQTVGVVVASGMGVLADFTEKGEAMPPLGAWSVDSAAVARSLRDDPRWPEPTPSMASSWTLQPGESGPVWTVEVYDMEGEGAEHMAQVDAQTGDVLSVERPTFERPTLPAGPMFAQTGEVVARVEPGMFVGDTCLLGCIEVPFELAEPGTLQVDLHWGLEANDFDLYLLDEAGQVQARSATGPGTEERLEVDLPAGAYRVSIAPFVVVHDVYAVQGVLL